MNVSTINAPRSPLFHAALQLLAAREDGMTILCRLRDAFPHTDMRELCRVVKETAVLFAFAGLQP